MATLSARTLISNVAALFSPRWGAVTEQARQAGCSRQAIYQQEARVVQAVEDAQLPGPSREVLLEENRRLKEENQQLWAWLETAIEFPAAKQQQFTGTASAMGLSLRQIAVLLAIILPQALCPKRSTLGRWVEQACARAGRLLQVLDRACHNLVLTLCLDEIFLGRQPVLMAVEPHSMTWVIGQRSSDRTGTTWCTALEPWQRLSYVAADGGSGLRRGLELIRQKRQQAGSTVPLEVTLDNFHIQQEGRKALRAEWQEAERIWQKAEQADRAVTQKGTRRGEDARPEQTKAHFAWLAAEEALATAECREAAFQRIVAALDLFRPSGESNDRAWATAEIQAAVKDLPGPRWAKFRRMALAPQALTFLDRLQRELEEAEPRVELRAALLKLWQARHPQPSRQQPTTRQRRDPALVAVRTMVCQKLDANWQTAYVRVAWVLRRTVRASSVVECMNSVVRMHQSRHRGLSNPLIDLKRLYWNCRDFAEGKRKGHSPYKHLGLILPTYDWWTLLQMDPDELEQKLSTLQVTE
jgi:hypothetical protein